MATLGVLLAGGRGSRLGGGVPKALVPCAGRTLLARALDTLAPLCDELVVVAPAGMELPLERATRVDDPHGAQGPLPALLAGLSARAFEEAVALAVDMPLVTSHALRALRALRADALAVMTAPGGLWQPLAAWYASAARERLDRAHASGERSLIVACRALAPVVVEDDARSRMPEGEGFQWNVNTPAELSRVERLLSERTAR